MQVHTGHTIHNALHSHELHSHSPGGPAAVANTGSASGPTCALSQRLPLLADTQTEHQSETVRTLHLAFQARNAVERELREERFAREAVERRSADLERNIDALRTQLKQKEVC